MKLEGLFTALVTPFNSEGKLDEEGLRHNLHYQLKNNVQGIVILGTTGEAPTLSPQERQAIIKIALEEINGKAILMVGTGSYSTEQTILSTLQAQEMGADAALIVTPYYNKPTQEGFYLHFKAICEATSIPICLYNIQSRTGQNLQTNTLERLTHFPNIIGVKDSSCNMMQISEIIGTIGKINPHFKILSGDDALTLPIMALGGHGVISVASNLVPGPMQNLVQAALSRDFSLACNWHYQLLPFFNAAFIETNPIPIKAAMKFCGMASGPCRLPLCDLSADNFEKLKKILNTLPPFWLGKYGQTKSSYR